MAAWHLTRGKITLASSIFGASLLILVGFVLFEFQVPRASADDVQTSITVLNTPPTWNGGEEGREHIASATSTPTNSGNIIAWIGTATDSSGDPYYLIICKTSVMPTANASAAPTCDGGNGNRWAVSTSTVSGFEARAATTTTDVAPFHNEVNDWWAWVCDGNASLPRCYNVASQGITHGDNGSPFVMNHAPAFNAVNNDGPANPGESVTWFSTAFDNDVLGGQDTVQLFVCQTAGFSTSTGCTGTPWAISTSSTANPATTTPIANPTRDSTYNAFVYLMDNHGRVATTTVHGSNSSFVVNNMAPTISAATISLEDTDSTGRLTLTVPNGQTSGFHVHFVVSDDNSCQNISSGNEISSAIANIYRSGVTQALCQVAGDYNANSCYPDDYPAFSMSCAQDAAVDTCSGATDATVGWTCTFPLWYNADPTFSGTPWDGEHWLASVRATDDDAATSSLTEDTDGNEMDSFLAFDVPQSGIPYGALEPGQFSDPLSTTTALFAYGNVGLDQDLYGDTMCRTTEWTGPDTCDTNGINPANDIPITNQKAATSSVSFSSPQAVTLSSSSTPVEVLINVPKTTATSSPETRSTYWGINIPSAITTAGDYEGQNTITAKVSNFLNW